MNTDLYVWTVWCEHPQTSGIAINKSNTLVAEDISKAVDASGFTAAMIYSCVRGEKINQLPPPYPYTIIKSDAQYFVWNKATEAYVDKNRNPQKERVMFPTYQEAMQALGVNTKGATQCQPVKK